MIYLNPNSSNTFFIVCDDIITVEEPVYLFRFIHEQTKEVHFVELENEIPDNARAEKFTLTLPSDVDLDGGYHELNVFQSEESGDRDVDNMLLLWPGKVEVKIEFQNDIVYSGDDEQDIVYNYGEEADS